MRKYACKLAAQRITRWIEEGYHMVNVKVDGKYYEIEVPYDVLAMQ